jgi:hypothetical protein
MSGQIREQPVAGSSEKNSDLSQMYRWLACEAAYAASLHGIHKPYGGISFPGLALIPAARNAGSSGISGGRYHCLLNAQ